MIPRHDISLPAPEANHFLASMTWTARTGALLLADVTAFAVSAALLPHANNNLFGVAAALIVVLRVYLGLFPGRGLHPHEVMRRSLIATVSGGLAVCVSVLALRQDAALGLGVLAFAVAALPLQLLARVIVRHALHLAGLWSAQVHIIAPPELMSDVADFFRRNWHFGLMPTTATHARIALVTEHSPTPTRTRALLDTYSEVIVLADMPQLRIIGLRPSDVQGSVGLRLSRPRKMRGGLGLKRFCDLAIAIPTFVLALPIIAVAAAAIWIADPGPVFYSQSREGQDGRRLRVLKLRSMYRDAERILQGVLDADPQARAEWEAHFKLRNDPRILPVVGRFIRASSCDELPQLLNVIAGGMSLVGPRPFPEYHLAVMRPEFRAKRCTVPPGITGLWQISTRSEADVDQQQQLDEFYIDNRSFWLDVSILLRTVPAVLLRRGAY